MECSYSFVVLQNFNLIRIDFFKESFNSFERTFYQISIPIFIEFIVPIKISKVSIKIIPLISLESLYPEISLK